MRIDASRNVGIGYPGGATLGAGYTNVHARGATGAIVEVSNATHSAGLDMSSSGARVGSRTAIPLSLIVGNAECVHVDTSGNVGINTIPDAGVKLDVDAGAARLQLSSFYLTLNGEDASGGVARSFRMRPSTTTADANAFNLGFYGSSNAAEYGFMAFPTADPSGYDSTKIITLKRSNGFAGFGNTDPTAQIDSSGDTIRTRGQRIIATPTTAGNTGDHCWDATYEYRCIAPNTWRRWTRASW
jgi:hypothetical protein